MQQQNISQEMSIIDTVIEYSNLLFAWNKFRNSSERGDVWYDGFEFVRYEANLRNNLLEIQEKVSDGRYRLTMMHELPYPKGSMRISENKELADDVKNDPCIQLIPKKGIGLRYRTTYHISISDQILWIAIINVIGEEFENEMPEWSYNYRLFRRVWYDEEKKLHKGLFRPSDKQLYRKWTQTWPLYKKQISTTIRILRSGIKDVVKADDEDSKTIKDAPDLIYFRENFFESKQRDEICWASLDIKKFYPTVKIELLEKKLIEPEKFKNDVRYRDLIKTMLAFKVENPKEKNIGIPTGLFVAGFLSNVYLLDADKYVEKKFKENSSANEPQKIAHFRYVDDHVILATDYNALMEWVKDYKKFLKKNLGLTINEEKSNLQDSDTEKIPENAKLNTDYPSPLMTISLQKLSALSRLNLDLLSKREFDLVLMDLQQMLVTDIPDEEIKRETRISFSITMLSRIIVDGDIDWDALYHIRTKIITEIRRRKKELGNVLNSLFDDSLPKIKNPDECAIPEIDEYNRTLSQELKRKDQLLIRIFNLIKYALNEEPNKPKIWLRALEFIYRHPKNEATTQINIDMLVDLLDKQKKNQIIHEQSYDYLLSILMIEIGILLLRNLFDEKYLNVNEMAYNSLCKFINSEDTLKNPIYKSAINVAKSACLYYSIKYKIKRTFAFDYNDTMYELYALAAVSNNEEAYYDIFHCYIPSWQASVYREAYLKATVSSKMIVEDLLNTTEGQNILNEAYRLADYPIAELECMRNIHSSPNGTELYKVIANNVLRYHQRIDLMIAIAKNVNKWNFNPDEFIKINIFNFTVKEKMEVSFKDNVSDMRCRNLFASSSNFVKYPLYQLGIIFYQILTGEPFIPEILNSDQAELNWNRYLLKMYQKCTVSSMSLAILRSCFSNRNLETIFFGRSFNLNVDDIEDITLDPPIFIYILDMIEALEKEMAFLKHYQVKDIPAEGEEADDVILMQVTNITKNFNPMENGEEIF